MPLFPIRHRTNIIRLVSGAVFLAVIGVGIYLIIEFDLVPAMRFYIASEVSGWQFVVLMTLLPIIGFPISVFLLLVGMKFGIVPGLLLSAVLMTLHMLITYILVHSYFREWARRLMSHFKFAVPGETRKINQWHAFFFMLLPGLPYAVKNCLLALSGMGLAPYLLVNWTAQFGLSIPLIIMGGAIMEMHWPIIALAVLLVAGTYALQNAIKSRLKRKKLRLEELEVDKKS